MQEMALERTNLQKFPKGAYPQTPLDARAFSVRDIACSTNNLLLLPIFYQMGWNLCL